MNSGHFFSSAVKPSFKVLNWERRKWATSAGLRENAANWVSSMSSTNDSLMPAYSSPRDAKANYKSHVYNASLVTHTKANNI